MKCRSCGRIIEDNSIFCNWCGKRQLREKKKTVSVPKPRRLPSGKWFAQVMVDGQRVPVTGDTEADYRAKAIAVKSGLIDARKLKKGKSLSAAMAEYIERKRSVLSPSTVNGYESILKDRFSAYTDKDITAIDWQKMVSDEARLCSAKTLKNAWGFVRAVLRSNDIEPPDVQLPQIVKADRPWLDYEQIQVFLSAMEGRPGELTALLALHSLRRSELLALTAGSIDLANEQIFVHGSAVIGSGNKLVYKKTNKNISSRRTVPIMIPRLKTLLEDAVRSYPQGPLIQTNPSTMHGQINAVCERAGLPKVGVHGLRKSFASLAYHLGWSELETMRIGGWSDFKTMREIYTKLAEGDLSNSVAKMQEFYSQNADFTNEITNG